MWINFGVKRTSKLSLGILHSLEKLRLLLGGFASVREAKSFHVEIDSPMDISLHYQILP